MIQITDKGIYVEDLHGPKAIKLLWDLLNVVGHKFVAVGFSDEADSKAEVVKVKGRNILLYEFNDEESYYRVISRLSDNVITEFYIIINATIKGVKDTIASFFVDGYFDEDGFFEHYPTAIHIGEKEFFVPFAPFRAYDFQLKRVAKRYMK